MAQAWHDYFGMLGAAAATLLGLLFVSVSINAETILGSAHKHSMHLAEQAFHNYIAAVIVSLVAFFPGISNTSLGLTILFLAGLYSVRLLIRFYKAMRAPRAADSRIEAVRRYGSTLSGFVLLAVGGAQMARDNQLEPIIAMGGLVLIVSATAISWQLLVRVAQTRYGAGKNDS
jgi:steroid 5-alpha reductase family enzyme